WYARSRNGGWPDAFSVDPKRQDHLWIGTFYDLSFTNNAGQTWNIVDSFQGVASVDAVDGRVLVYARRNNASNWGLWYSPNAGTTWQQLDNANYRFPNPRNSQEGKPGWKFVLDRNDPNKFWCGGVSVVAYTFNGGSSSNTAPSITTNPSSATVTAGNSATFSVAASGNPTPTFQWQRAANGSSTFNNLSNGGSYSGVTSSSLTVSNTTTTMSGDRFRAVATNSVNSAPSTAATLTVNAPAITPPSITSALSTTATQNSSFSYTIVATNSPTSYNATSLPAGLSVNTSTGVISGTPTGSGTSNVSISATNGGGTDTETLLLTVNAASGGSGVNRATGGSATSNNTDSPTNETVAQAFDGNVNTKWLTFSNAGWIRYTFGGGASWNITSYAVTSANDAPERDPRNWTLEGSNNGTNWTTVDTRSNETFSARLQRRVFTVASPGTFSSYRLNVSGNQSGSILQLAELELYSGSGSTVTTPSITSSLTTTATQNSSFSYSIVATNSPTSYNATSLPAGLSVNTSTGVISGTPTGTGTSNVSISATNGGGTDTETLVLTVNAASGGGGSPVKLTGTVIGTTGSWNNNGYTRDKAFDGDTNSFFDAAGANGNWVGLDLGSAQVVNQVRYYPRSDFPDRMNGGVFQGSNTADFSSGVTTLHTISGNPPISFTSVVISNGSSFRYVRYLSPNGGYGNVAEVEFYRSDGGGGSPVINSALTASGVVNAPFTYTITGSNTPTGYNATSLPAGLSINTSTGVISGRPTASGTSNVGITASNGNGTGSSTLVLSVTGTNITITNNGFETDTSQTPSTWLTWANTTANEAGDFSETANPRLGSRNLRHGDLSGAYQLYTYQVITGLTNGTYTLRGWSRSSGGQTSVNIGAKSFGAATALSTPITASTSYVERVVSNIQVTNGQIDLGIWSNASAGTQWLTIDDITLTRVSP
ncbi:MAG: hypothetical protein EAZ42_07145, partial [Verrucomicrobia bacterium]